VRVVRKREVNIVTIYSTGRVMKEGYDDSQRGEGGEGMGDVAEHDHR
jgi:hypothetical protein